jgi:putative ABC transport system permease protein
VRKTDLFRLAWTNLGRRKVRTGLTTVGVIIGTAAIVTMVSLGVGLQKNLTAQISRIGELHEIEVFPKYDFSASPAFGGDLPPPVKPLDEAAIKELRAIEGVVAVLPTVWLPDVELTYGRYQTRLSLTGIDPVESGKLEVALDSGRYLRRGDDKVLVLGYKVPALLQEQDRAGSKGRRLGKTPAPATPAAEKISLQNFHQPGRETKDRPDLLRKAVFLKLTRFTADGREETKTVRFKVVGVAAETGGLKDREAVLPLKAAQELIRWRENLAGDQAQKKGYETVKVRVETPEMVETVQQEIAQLGFESFSLKQMLATVNTVATIVQVLLGGIGGIALLVASLGIMNTMIIAIYERTREIGIMKVIGASVNDVKQLFLLEAGSIGFIGGTIGLGVGWSGAQLINLVANAFLAQGGGDPVTVVYVPLWLALFAVGFATVIGLLSGLYPALRAAKMSPLTAIRQE